MSILLMLLACGETEKTDTGENISEMMCEDVAEVECLDDLILDLSLQDDKVSEGEVSNEQDGDDFITYVDASAGGYMNASSNPWIYIKFTPEGAEKVEIDDESALESMDWDLSMRRFLLRLNGGSSGPSCVGAATFLESTYESLTAVPEGLTFSVDNFYTSDCTLINDSSGLPDSPQVALGAWWTYPGCVATSMYPHIIQLADGSHIKLVVEAYYGSNQENCNDNEAPGSDSANFTLRWSYL